MRKTLIALIALTLPTFAIAKDPVQERMLDNLNTVKSIFETQYAPAEWKNRLFGWDLETQITQSKNEVLSKNDIDIKDYQKILRDFLNSTRDYHVGVEFFSTEMAYLPFIVKSVDDKFYISEVDRERLSRRVFPIEVGDELVSIDGTSPAEFVKDFIKEMTQSNPLTDQALADVFLTRRMGFLGMSVPKGPIKIAVRSNDTDKVRTYQLIWDYYPEKIQNGAFYANTEPKKANDKLNIFNMQMISPLSDLITSHSQKIANWSNSWADAVDADDEAMTQLRSFVPALGSITWQTESNNPFFAYIYQNENGRPIGYVRIPSFTLESDHIPELALILQKMQESADALVIDELDNPGGYVFQVYAIISMLTDKPLVTPRHRLMISQEDVYEAWQDIGRLQNIKSDQEAEDVLGADVFGYPVTYQYARFALDFSRFIIDEWNAGRRFTEPTYLSGIDQINPHPWVNFTKPLLILVNEMDFSSGDFFPAILQDNKRAVIFGNRTAGAGGAVRTITFPNRLGIVNLKFTTSIAERTDLMPIENLGVIPDVPYALTHEDVFNKYQGYIKAVNHAVDDLFTEKSETTVIKSETPQESTEPVVETLPAVEDNQFSENVETVETVESTDSTVEVVAEAAEVPSEIASAE